MKPFYRGNKVPVRKAPPTCVYAEVDFDSSIRRCSSPPQSYTGTHGWLCTYHADLQDKHLRKARPYDDGDSIIRAIIHAETKALKEGIRIFTPSCPGSRLNLQTWEPDPGGWDVPCEECLNG